MLIKGGGLVELVDLVVGDCMTCLFQWKRSIVAVARPRNTS